MTDLAPAPAKARPEFTLGDRLRKAREHRGLSRLQFATKIGIHRDSVAAYETDRQIPRLLVLRAWADETGVELNWIVEGRPSDYTPPRFGQLAPKQRPRSRTDARRPGDTTSRRQHRPSSGGRSYTRTGR